MPSLVTLLVGAVLLYAAGFAYFYIAQERFIYFPTSVLAATPKQVGLAFENIEIPTEDGELLHGWYVPSPNARASLLFLHGNAGNISHRLESLQQFHRLNLDVLLFDYRGYGRSTGRPSEQGTYRDAEAAWNYLTEQRHIPPQRLVVFGRSLGGGVAVDLATRHTPAAVLIESTFASGEAMARELAPWYPASWITRIHYDSAKKISAIQSPVLVIHSTEDEIVPFAHARMLFARAREPKHLLELRGGHNDAFFVSPNYLEGIDRFLHRHLEPAAH